jgi:hypothetical protein
VRITRQRLKKIAYQRPGAEQQGPPQVGAEAIDAALPGSMVHLPESPDWQEIPFPPPDPERAYRELDEFYRARPCFALLHGRTGLPGCLRGNLQDPQDGSPEDVAEAFLRQHEFMLAGLDRGTRLRRVYRSDWADGTCHVAFAQTNGDNVPIYGGNIVCNFSADRLTLVTSTVYPVGAIMDSFQWRDWREAKALALDALVDLKEEAVYDIIPQRFMAPPDLRAESREQGLLVDRWILPYHRPERGEKTGTYRPVWRVLVVDQHNGHWLILVDAEKEVPLIVHSLEVEATVRADLFATAGDAIEAPSRLTEKPLNYGWGNSTIFDAAHVHMDGDLVVEPSDPTKPDRERQISATVFYHGRKVQEQFKLWLFGQAFAGDPVANPDPTDDIDILVEDRQDSPKYDQARRLICLTAGTGGQYPILEPGLDCEVLYHEFTHAVLRYLSPEAFRFSSYAQMRYTLMLDEGLAFYFACAFAANQRWAEFAYQRWVKPPPDSTPWRDLVVGPRTPQDAEQSGDPTDVYHGVGMWWARVFWALASGLGQFRCSQLLLKAFDLLSGPVDSLEAFPEVLLALATEAEKQQIESTLSEFGLVL